VTNRKSVTIKQIAAALGLDKTASEETAVRGFVTVLVAKGVMVKDGEIPSTGKGKGATLYRLTHDARPLASGIVADIIQVTTEKE